MEAVLTDLLSAVNDFLSERVGLYFSEMRYADLERGLQSASGELKYKDPRSFLEDLLASKLSKTQLQTVVRNLTIGETYFFRDPAVFLSLEEKLLPEAIKRKKGSKHLRIWSAGCSTGEEPYSIAISLLRALKNFESWQINLIATDINTHSLERAAKATYNPWSFRTMPEDFVPSYFENLGDAQFKLTDKARNIVRFDYLNLAEDPYPSLASDTNDLDIIFCRNVLIYFTQQKSKEIVDKLSTCLGPGGVLITSANDSARFITSNPDGLERISSTMFCKKES